MINKIKAYVKIALITPIVVCINLIYALLIGAVIPSLLLYNDWMIKITGGTIAILVVLTIIPYYFKTRQIINDIILEIKI